LGRFTQRAKFPRDVSEFDMIELNEAFVRASLACIKELKLDEAKVNPDGGAICVGTSHRRFGARLLGISRIRKPKRGLALCASAAAWAAFGRGQRP